MNVLQAIENRHSTRAFTDKDVSRTNIERILDAARHCGSFVNCQPWKFTVLGGSAMKEWKDRLWEMFLKDEHEEREYYCGPMPMPEPQMSRGDAFRNKIDNLIFPPGIPDREVKHQAYVKSGIIVRDAPAAVLIHMDKAFAASPLHVLAAGGVTQAIALAAEELGLGSCIMGRPVESPRLLRSISGIPETDTILCCIALGYEDETAPINSLAPGRAGVSELTAWVGFDK